MTDDGNYYIAYYHPASTKLLPGDFEAIGELIEDEDAFAENFETYLQELNDQLEAAEAAEFTPDLTKLDAMLESLQIQP